MQWYSAMSGSVLLNKRPDATAHGAVPNVTWLDFPPGSARGLPSFNR